MTRLHMRPDFSLVFVAVELPSSYLELGRRAHKFGLAVNNAKTHAKNYYIQCVLIE